MGAITDRAIAKARKIINEDVANRALDYAKGQNKRKYGIEVPTVESITNQDDVRKLANRILEEL